MFFLGFFFFFSSPYCYFSFLIFFCRFLWVDLTKNGCYRNKRQKKIDPIYALSWQRGGFCFFSCQRCPTCACLLFTIVLPQTLSSLICYFFLLISITSFNHLLIHTLVTLYFYSYVYQTLSTFFALCVCVVFSDANTTYIYIYIEREREREKKREREMDIEGGNIL